MYKVTILLLRTLRFPEIRTCKTTDEMGWVISCYDNKAFCTQFEMKF